jgi:porin
MHKHFSPYIYSGFIIRIGLTGTLRIAAAVVTLFLLIPSSVLATETETKSGYEDVSELGEGPSDITDELEMDDRVKDTLLGVPIQKTPLAAWFSAKKTLYRKTGLQFGLNYTGLYQKASHSLDDQDQAAGGRLQIEGTWTAIGRDTPNRGILGFRLQDRHRIGTDLPPSGLGPAIGSVWTTGFGFNEFDFSLTDLWWEQQLLQGNLCFRFGKYLPFNIFDPFSLKSPLMGFQNAAFTGTPAFALPEFGLGAAGKLRFAANVELILGINDANGKPTSCGFDTFFDDREYFAACELRWSPKFQSGSGKFHITTWHTDAREQAQTPNGWGAAFSGECKTGRWTPFLRYNYSDGGATILDHLIAGGIGIGDLFGQNSDLISLGLSWGKPHNKKLDGQSAAEVFYRIHLLPFMTLTPSVQAVINPARNPNEDLIVVLGIRTRFAF